MSTSINVHVPEGGIKATTHDLSRGGLWLELTTGEKDDVTYYMTADQLAALAEDLTDIVAARPITCGTCEGGKVIIVGWEPDFGDEQGEEIEGRCPICEGEGTIPNGTFLEDFKGYWPDESEARFVFKNAVESALGERGE